MIFRTAMFVLCAWGIFGVQAHAQIYLEQAKVTVNVDAGEHTNGTLLVHNTSSEKVDIKVYWEDFQYKSPYDGSKNFLPAGTAPNSASQWITFSPQEFSMPAFGQQMISYSVTVPSEIKEGHYGVLFFEKSSSGELNHEAVTLITRVGCLFFVEPNNKIKKAALQDIVLKDKSIDASFVNLGNVVLIPHTTFYIMQDAGLVVLRGECKKLYVPPGASGNVVIPLKQALKQGHYTLVVNADLDEGDVVVKEIGLSVDASGQVIVENSQQ